MKSCYSLMHSAINMSKQTFVATTILCCKRKYKNVLEWVKEGSHKILEHELSRFK